MEGIYSSKELKPVTNTTGLLIDSTENKKESNNFLTNIRALFEKPFRFTVMELAISGLCISLFLVTSTILHFMGLSKIFKAEILFCILYGIVLGPIKGAFLGIIADVLSLLLTGRIGLWYWTYQLVPGIIAFLSAIYFALFKSSVIARIVIPFVVIFSAMAIMIYIYTQRVVKLPNGDTGISFSNSIKPRPLDRETKYPYLISLIGMIIYLFFSLITVVAIISFYVKSKNPKFLDYLLIFSIVTFIQVVYRWIFGPILYIQYRNYIDNKNWSYADKYLTFAIPIVVKSMINIPIYTVVLSAIYPVINLLCNKYIGERNKVSY
ncbi:ECF transporter S component [Mycoplasmopsis bovis]|uniref:ECF transporter S component n=2 Tax=Mycoplasmopsis bovis TaxID=28903 RepID=A0A2N8U2S9_MYCBV|nr:ECF transporter S component [Mycoplasmopsis bovis]MBT1315518.1 ECF transporter S component [Mycoplasmopsis bovis]MBT1316072.1 ECF transporter S component [Mycoplasmopsis bovis]MBT1316645.1 ECF transporter S component [Mycoplasmopsis bovis]MBT1317566.1 ECF transporter S component [Mycoplasmopsis bovis]MBT1319082.1 ECF transporter S component [Mycoplasmopsis bovis]